MLLIFFMKSYINLDIFFAMRNCLHFNNIFPRNNCHSLQTPFIDILPNILTPII